MTWEEKAKVFNRALARGGGDVVQALRAVEKATGRGGPAKLTDAQLVDMRRRWGRGEKQAAIAAQFRVSEASVRQRCRDVPRPAPPDLGHLPPQVCALVADELGLEPGWADQVRAIRGRPPLRLALARRAVALVLAQLGMGKREIGRRLFADAASVFCALQRADTHMPTQRVALAVLMQIEGEQARAAA